MDFRKRGLSGWLTPILMFFVMACGGGSCSSCEGCGIEPIPGGYPLDQRVPNAVQVRLTESGFAFVEQDINTIAASLLSEAGSSDGESFDVPVPTIEEEICFDVPIIGTVCQDVAICESGGCVIRASITNLDLQPMNGTSSLGLDTSLTVEAVPNLPITAKDLPIVGDVTCDVGIDTTAEAPDDLTAGGSVDLIGDTHTVNGTQWGYTAAGASLSIESNAFQNDDIDLCGLPGWVQDPLKGFVIGEIETQLASAVDGLLQDALCMQPGEAGCPTGTTPSGGTCEFSDGECVPMLLGLDGQGDLGASFLSGFAAGAHGPMRILAALAGDARVENNGLSLQMYGGAQSLNRELDPDSFPGHDACVPVTDPPELPDIPLAMSLEGNTVPGTGEPTHVGIGIAESFIDYAAWNAFDSGMLCLGAGTSLAQELSTGLFSLLVQSLNNVTFPHSEQPLAIMVRPQQPPDIDIGETAEDDPLMNVELPELELDFYVWTQERYVRFMTYKADLALDVNLQVDGAAGTIAPVIGEVEASNSEITNSDILSEDPQMLAGTIEGLIGSFAGMLTGSIDAIELPEIEGFELDVPEGGVQGFEDEGERFLGIFANLGLAGASTGARHPVETELEIVDVTMDPESLRLEGFGQGNPTTIVARAEAFGTGVDYEYSYRLDGMEWSQWTTNPKLVIQDEVLFFQARHTLEVRARVAGMPETVDPTPASEEILIDVLAPTVETESTDEGVRVVAADVVSPRDALQYRYRVEGGDWSEWAGLDGEPVLDAAPDGVDVEVRDEAGNVGSNRQALIRGLPDANAEGACDCAVPGSTSSGTPLAGLGALLLLGLALRRRRSQTGRGKAAAARLMKAVRRVAPFLALPLALYVVGCGGKDGGGGGSACEDDCVRATFDTPTGGLCCESEGMCVAYDLDELCEGVEFCHEDEVELDDDCGVVCNECVLPPNTPGQIATYTDMTALSDGSLAISGYNPGNPSTSPQRLFGDLVVGISDGSEIEWEPVDGVPDSPPTLAEDSWRGGVVEPGPDVGQWTSVAAADDDTLYVSYYDVSNQGVKIAIGTPGDWAMHTIEEEGDAGLHTSITLEDGSPRIAYLQILPPEGDGQPTARVRVAMADGANPAAATDWEVTTAHEASIDCRPQWCPDGTTCVASGQCLADPGDAEELPDPYIEDMPVAPGLYNNLFVDSDGLALVFYDRTMGRIRAVRWQGDTWSAPMDLDGYQVPGSDSGDSGIGASVFVEGDVWHLTYVDGANEHLMYARVEDAGATVATREVVDDGAVEGGRHVVGDDSSVVVADGEIRVVYQDSTVAHALIATRSEEDTWEVATLDDENFTGFWLEQVAMDGTSYVSTFWMRTAAAGSGTRILTYP